MWLLAFTLRNGLIGQCTRTCDWTVNETPVHTDDQDCACLSVTELVSDENILNSMLSNANAACLR
jgi:hypothetical protein